MDRREGESQSEGTGKRGGAQGRAGLRQGKLRQHRAQGMPQGSQGVRTFRPRTIPPSLKYPKPKCHTPEGQHRNTRNPRVHRLIHGGGGGYLVRISCGDYFVRGLFRAGIISCGDAFATLAYPKAHTASRTHCTAKGPRFRRGRLSPPFLKANFSHEMPRLSLSRVAGG